MKKTIVFNYYGSNYPLYRAFDKQGIQVTPYSRELPGYYKCEMEESRIPEILEVMKKQGIGLTMMNAEFTLFPRGGDENIRREEHDPAEKDENKRRDLLMRTQYGRNAQPDERVRYLTGKVITREKGEPIAPPELETRKASTYRSYNSANLTVHDTDFVPLNDKPLKPERPVTPRTKTRGYDHISL